MPDQPTHYRSHRTYTDFDALATEARQWDLELQQLDAGEFQGRVLQFGIGNVHIGEARFGRTLKQSGAPPAGMRTIAVPGSAGIDWKWRGVHVDGQSLMIFPRGAELDATSDSRFHVFTCSFPESLLASAAEALGIEGFESLAGGHDVVKATATHMAKLRHTLRELCDRMTDDESATGDAEFVETVTRDLPSLLLTATQTSSSRPMHLSAAKRARILSSAEDYIEQRADESLTVAQVCQAVQTSLRALQYAFAEKYGISPKAYIRAIRLNKARRELRASDPAQFAVSDIANRWGFWHMGQFAADYRRHFGELPSETLLGGKQTSRTIPL